MSGIPEPSERVGLKARRLLGGFRVQLISAEEALVRGDTGTYLVQAEPEGLTCECRSAREPSMVACGHRVAAAIAWAESGHLVEPFDPEPEL